jgi:CelD/BcsL family acetyltransferase involved in cellulose biosynthesis
MTLIQATDDEAFRLLQDSVFQSRWNDLNSACPWSTAFQSFCFVSAWYNSYRSIFRPLIIYELSGGVLNGLLCLAVEKDSNRIVVAGTHHAEYQVWLTRTGDDSLFIRSALDSIREQRLSNSLVFKFLPAETPVSGLSAGAHDSWRFSFESRTRGIVPLDQEELVASHLRPKREGRTNRYKLNKLKRLGDVRLERLSDPHAVDLVLDQLIAFYDLRQAATHGDTPFLEDPLKKTFHRALANVPGLVHLTVMRAGGHLVSALFGIVGKGMLSLAMPMFSPIYADCSPMIWHVLMLMDQLREEGFSVFDLTPGSDPFKEEFRVASEAVTILTVFHTRGLALRVNAKARVVAAAKAILRQAKVEPSSVKKLTRVASPSAISSALKALSALQEIRLYSLSSRKARGLASSTELSSGRFEDLLLFPLHSKERTAFLGDALRRLAKGQQVYTATDRERLQFAGWLGECKDKIFFPETGLEVALSTPSVLLSITHSTSGQESEATYEKWARQMTADAGRLLGEGQILFSVPANDRPFCSILARLGFIHQQSLFRRTRFGKVISWSQTMATAAETRASFPK